jgi:hypothetical protein
MLSVWLFISGCAGIELAQDQYENWKNNPEDIVWVKKGWKW